MRHIFEYLFFCATLFATVHANPVPNGVVKLDTQHKHTKRSAPPKSKRDGTVSVPLPASYQWGVQGAYYVDIEVGTPPQKLSLKVDTGSANLWLPSAQASACSNDYRCPLGSYNSKDSSTYSFVNTPAVFNISYISGSRVWGNYAADNIDIAGAKLNQCIFALADTLHQLRLDDDDGNDSPQIGLMGVSYDADESSVCPDVTSNGRCTSNFTTPTVTDALFNAGYIKSHSYSLYLDDVASRTGSMLWGGIDTSKFYGELVTLGNVKSSLLNNQMLHVKQNLYLTAVSGKTNGKSTTFTPGNYSVETILDSGNPGVGLPTSVFKQLRPYLPVVEKFPGWYGILCKDAETIDMSITIELTGSNGKSVSIEVPFINFVTPYYGTQYNSTTPFQQGGEDACLVAIYDSEGSNSLGDPFLRSAYAFHDLDAKTISIAQASYDTTGSNIIAVNRGDIPTFTGTGKQTPPSGPYPSRSSVVPPASPNSGTLAEASGMLLFSTFVSAMLVVSIW